MTGKKVLFVTTEITPYLAASNMATIARKLPQGILERGKSIRTFMPKFGLVNDRRSQLHDVIRLSGMNLVIGGSDHPLMIKVASIQSARMQVYFIDNEDFFNRRKHLLHDSEGKEFEDNDVRSLFYVRGVMETVRKLQWIPDLIHCHGWMTALLPLYVKKHYKNDPCFKNTKVIYSIYDDGFEQPFRAGFAKKVKLEGVTNADLKHIESTASFEAVTKLAIDFSDGVIQNSPRIHEDVRNYLIGGQPVPFLDYQPEEIYIEKFNEFYDQILNT
jgi:starch synthase